MSVVQPAVPIRISQRAKSWEVSGILGSAVPIGPSVVPVQGIRSAGSSTGSSDQDFPEGHVLGGLWDSRVGSADMSIGSFDTGHRK